MTRITPHAGSSGREATGTPRALRPATRRARKDAGPPRPSNCGRIQTALRDPSAAVIPPFFQNVQPAQPQSAPPRDHRQMGSPRRSSAGKPVDPPTEGGPRARFALDPSQPASSTPASTPSGRSVTSRITRVGIPRLVASSWMPPESVSTRVACFMQVDHRQIIQRRQKGNVWDPSKQPVDRFLDVGVEVNGIDQLQTVWIGFGQGPQGAADIFNAFAQVFSAVSGD